MCGALPLSVVRKVMRLTAKTQEICSNLAREEACIYYMQEQGFGRVELGCGRCVYFLTFAPRQPYWFGESDPALRQTTNLSTWSFFSHLFQQPHSKTGSGLKIKTSIVDLILTVILCFSLTLLTYVLHSLLVTAVVGLKEALTLCVLAVLTCVLHYVLMNAVVGLKVTVSLLRVFQTILVKVMGDNTAAVTLCFFCCGYLCPRLY